MKLPTLLAQFLYTHKRLQLAGIGSFTFNGVIDPDSGTSKSKSDFPAEISFKGDHSTKDDDELISYITTQTGKMKALAASDLHSHLELAIEFLNIGKPFELEGIGTLLKPSNGKLEFTPIGSENIKVTGKKEAPAVAVKEDTFSGYELLAGETIKRNVYAPSKAMIGLLLVVGAALAIWGGYTLSRNAGNNDEKTEEVIPALTLNSTDTAAKKEEPKPENYKYVLEIAKPKRAFERYAKLKEYNWNVQMETRDSVQYKLFMLFPIDRDSTKVRDSLSRLTGRKVYIDHGYE